MEALLRGTVTVSGFARSALGRLPSRGSAVRPMLCSAVIATGLARPFLWPPLWPVPARGTAVRPLLRAAKIATGLSGPTLRRLTAR
jgi:hypothetical protein